MAGWWFGTWLLFFHILGIIIPTDYHIFQRGGSTTNQRYTFLSCPMYFNSLFLLFRVLLCNQGFEQTVIQSSQPVLSQQHSFIESHCCHNNIHWANGVTTTTIEPKLSQQSLSHNCHNNHWANAVSSNSRWAVLVIKTIDQWPQYVISFMIIVWQYVIILYYSYKLLLYIIIIYIVYHCLWQLFLHQPLLSIPFFLETHRFCRFEHWLLAQWKLLRQHWFNVGAGSLLLAALAQCCCWQHWLNVVAGSIGSILLLAALAQCCCWQHWLNVVAGSAGSLLLWHDSESYSLFLQNPGCTATPGTKGTSNFSG